MLARCSDKTQNKPNTSAPPSLQQAGQTFQLETPWTALQSPKVPEQSPRNSQHMAEGHKAAILFKWPQQQGFHSFCLQTDSQSKHVHCERACSLTQHLIVNNSVTHLPCLTASSCLLTGSMEQFYFFCLTFAWNQNIICLAVYSKGRRLMLDSALDAEL